MRCLGKDYQEIQWCTSMPCEDLDGSLRVLNQGANAFSGCLWIQDPGMVAVRFQVFEMRGYVGKRIIFDPLNLPRSSLWLESGCTGFDPFSPAYPSSTAP